MRHIELLFVQITPACNLDCVYCPFSKNNISKNRHRDFKEVTRAVQDTLRSELFSMNSFGNLIIYGGEPLLHFKDVATIVDLYKEFRKDGNVTLCTNGILINSEAISFCKKNHISVAINFDGHRELVSKIKTLTPKDDQQIRKNISDLHLAKIPVDFSTTITPVFIEQFKEQIVYLESLGPRMIGFNFLRDKVAQASFAIVDPEDHLKSAVGQAIGYVSERNFLRKRKLTAYKSKVFSPDCICAGQGLTILADGSYTTCGIFDTERSKTHTQFLELSDKNQGRLSSEKYFEKDVMSLPTFGGGCSKLSPPENSRFARILAKASFDQFVYEKI